MCAHALLRCVSRGSRAERASEHVRVIVLYRARIEMLPMCLFSSGDRIRRLPLLSGRASGFFFLLCGRVRVGVDARVVAAGGFEGSRAHFFVAAVYSRLSKTPTMHPKPARTAWTRGCRVRGLPAASVQLGTPRAVKACGGRCLRCAFH